MVARGPPSIGSLTPRLFDMRRIALGKHFALTSSDSFKFGAYRADPAAKAKGQRWLEYYLSKQMEQDYQGAAE